MMDGAQEGRDFADVWDFGDATASEMRFKALLDEAGADDALRAEVLTQVARAQGLQGRFAEAESTLREAEGLLVPQMGAARVRCLLERGRVLRSSGRGDESRSLFAEAWERAREFGADGLAVDAAHMAALVADVEEALAWNERAVALAQDSSSEQARRWLGSLYNNIGWAHYGCGRFEEALAIFQLAVEERRRRGHPGPLLIARWCAARALRSLGRVDEALAEQQSLSAAHAEAGTDDGFVHEELGECLLALGRAGEAQREFARAYELLSADAGLAKAERERLERLRRLGAGIGDTETARGR